MSVSVKQLTKIYGTQKAIDEISFQVQKGEIVGLLGPNGAGKSTTMKILTCYLNATNGSASVCGFDTTTQPIEVRKRIGYLPEHNPLEMDMYVKEYLHYAGSFYPIQNLKQRISDLIDMTGLEKEQHKKIHQLSKGYRQRVGLAQALIHDPEVLILDEPTAGLDPNQLSDIRKLILHLGQQKTILLSTHIMQEVEALCKKVIIINHGKIVADQPTHLLQQMSNQQLVEVEFDKMPSKTQLLTLPEIAEVEVQGNVFIVKAKTQKDIRKTLFDFAIAHQLTVLKINTVDTKLEDVFRNLTKSK